MSTYQIHNNQVIKNWITINGVVGTAHMNRHDRWVDFRPATKAETQARFAGYEPGWWLVYTPAKGVDIPPLRIRYEQVVDAQYRYNGGTGFSATVTVAEPQNSELLGEPPERITVEVCNYVVSGWPLPESIKAQIATAKAADEERRRQEAEKFVQADEIAAYLEALPPGSQERRWVNRWLRTGKAYREVFDFVFEATGKRLSPRQVDAALNSFKAKVLGE